MWKFFWSALEVGSEAQGLEQREGKNEEDTYEIGHGGRGDA